MSRDKKKRRDGRLVDLKFYDEDFNKLLDVKKKPLEDFERDLDEYLKKMGLL